LRARIAAAEGDGAAAVELALDAAATFERLGLHADAALARLDAAELRAGSAPDADAEELAAEVAALRAVVETGPGTA
jgi:hypothetical protein